MTTPTSISFCSIPSVPSSGCEQRVARCFCTALTPTVARLKVAALYGARREHIDIYDALREVLAVLPTAAHPNADFRAALRRLHPRPAVAS